MPSVRNLIFVLDEDLSSNLQCGTTKNTQNKQGRKIRGGGIDMRREKGRRAEGPRGRRGEGEKGRKKKGEKGRRGEGEKGRWKEKKDEKLEGRR